MIPRRKFLVIILGIFTIFLITTNYLFSLLQSKENKVKNSVTIEEKIYHELNNLPEQYNQRPNNIEPITIFENFMKNSRQEDIKFDNVNLKQIWSEANSWTAKEKLLVDYNSPKLGKVLFALKNAAVVKADIDTRGTQLKLLLTLAGEQKVVFKPQWYPKEKVIEGAVYAGKDRYHSEIVAFYLSIILNRPLTPLSVEREISLKFDVLPVATKRLRDTNFEVNNRSCVYGQCYYCKKTDPICENKDHLLNGAVIFNFRGNLKKYRSPWQRTYNKKKAVWQEMPEKYCKTVHNKLSKKHIYDLIDTSIFDFLIQNGDRHHYEIFGDSVIWLDNGKGLGNPHVQHIDILAPLYQCCIIRRQMLKTLLNLTGGLFREKIKQMPHIENLLTEAHLNAMEERLRIIYAVIEYCKKQKQEYYEHYLL